MNTESDSFIARWSRRKRAAEEAKRPAADARPEAPPAAPAKEALESRAASPAPSAPTESFAATPEVALPPIETLDGLRSDYQAFFQQPVSEDLRHAALRKLFADPHFNKMDMLDVYVDDYTQFEPLPATLRMRLPSARAFLSDAERAEVEAAEAKAAESGAVQASSETASDAATVAPRVAEQSAETDAVGLATAPLDAAGTLSATVEDADRPADASAARPAEQRRAT